MDEPFDAGTEEFQPTNLEVTSIDMGNPAFNVVAQEATARFNIRFNDTWTADSVKVEIERRLSVAAGDDTLRAARPRPRLGSTLNHVSPAALLVH